MRNFEVEEGDLLSLRVNDGDIHYRGGESDSIHVTVTRTIKSVAKKQAEKY